MNFSFSLKKLIVGIIAGAITGALSAMGKITPTTAAGVTAAIMGALGVEDSPAQLSKGE